MKPLYILSNSEKIRKINNYDVAKALGHLQSYTLEKKLDYFLGSEILNGAVYEIKGVKVFVEKTSRARIWAEIPEEHELYIDTQGNLQLKLI